MSVPPQASNLPAGEPPAGVIPNFTDPVTANDAEFYLFGFGCFFASIFLIMRIYTKARILRKFGIEDVSIIVAFLFATADGIMILVGRAFGGGKHIWDVRLTTLVPRGLQLTIAIVVLYAPAMMFAKLAILLSFLRISPKKSFRVAVFITMAFVIAYSLAVIFALTFQCSPIKKAWYPELPGHCIKTPGVYVTQGACNIASDFTILLLPLPMIYHLKIPLRQKLLVASFFSVGSLTCIVSIIRLTTLFPQFSTSDVTWSLTTPGDWIIIEINLAIVCGCLSVMRPFVRKHLPFLIGETRRSHYNTPYSKTQQGDGSTPGHSKHHSKLGHWGAKLFSGNSTSHSGSKGSATLHSVRQSQSHTYLRDKEAGIVGYPMEHAPPSNDSGGDKINNHHHNDVVDANGIPATAHVVPRKNLLQHAPGEDRNSIDYELEMNNMQHMVHGNSNYELAHGMPHAMSSLPRTEGQATVDLPVRPPPAAAIGALEGGHRGAVNSMADSAPSDAIMRTVEVDVAR